MRKYLFVTPLLGFGLPRRPNLTIAHSCLRICRLLIAAVLVTGLPTGAFAGVTTVRYAATSFEGDHRGDYYVDLLKLALAKSGQRYEVKPAVQQAVGLRTAYSLTAGEGVNVMWSPTDPTVEKAALPIRVPLDKGILGLRLFLVNQNR